MWGCPLLADSGSSDRWIFSGTNDRYTSEAAIHILVAENSVRTSASPPKAAAQLISLPRAADDPKPTSTAPAGELEFAYI